MSSFDPVALTTTWAPVYDASANGDFVGIVEARGNTQVMLFIGTVAPNSGAAGIILDANKPQSISLSQAAGSVLYMRTISGAAVAALVQNDVSVAAVIGTKSDAMAGSDTGASSLMAFIKRLATGLTSLITNFSNYSNTGTINSLNQEVSIPIGNRGAVGIQIGGNAANGLITFYGSMDGGSTWVPAYVEPYGNSQYSVLTSTHTGTGKYLFNGGGFTNFKAKITTAPDSGSFAIILNATPAPRSMHVLGMVNNRLDPRTSQMEATLQGRCWFVQFTQPGVSGQFSYVQIWNPSNSGKYLQVSAILAYLGATSKIYYFTGNSAKGSTTGAVIRNNRTDYALDPVTYPPSFEVRGGSGTATTPGDAGVQITSTNPTGQGVFISGQSLVIAPGTGIWFEVDTINRAITLTATVTEIPSAQVA